MSEPAVLAADPGNRVIPVSAVARARFSQRFGICTLRLTLDSHKVVRFLWFNSAKSATRYDDARALLAGVLGERLRN
jgi:hypothetical protein